MEGTEANCHRGATLVANTTCANHSVVRNASAIDTRLLITVETPAPPTLLRVDNPRSYISERNSRIHSTSASARAFTIPDSLTSTCVTCTRSDHRLLAYSVERKVRQLPHTCQGGILTDSAIFNSD